MQVEYGDELMEFQAEMDARTQLTSVTGTAWDLKNQKIVQEKGSQPNLNKQGNISTQELAGVIDLDSYNIQTAAPIARTSVKSWSNAQLVKSGLARIRGRMKFQGSAKAAPGKWIELKRVGKRFNGEVIVTSVLHDISDGNWTSEVEFGFGQSGPHPLFFSVQYRHRYLNFIFAFRIFIQFFDDADLQPLHPR